MVLEHRYIIKTKRLLLKNISLTSYHTIFNTLNNEDGASLLGFSKKNFLKEKERYQSGFFNEEKSLHYFLIFDKQEAKNIGWCGFHTWHINQHYAEIGYEIYSQEYRRKGLMSEAIREVIDFGFENMDLKNIKAFIKSENTASINLIKTMNFTEDTAINTVNKDKHKSDYLLAFSLNREH